MCSAAPASAAEPAEATARYEAGAALYKSLQQRPAPIPADAMRAAEKARAVAQARFDAITDCLRARTPEAQLKLLDEAHAAVTLAGQAAVGAVNAYCDTFAAQVESQRAGLAALNQ